MNLVSKMAPTATKSNLDVLPTASSREFLITLRVSLIPA